VIQRPLTCLRDNQLPTANAGLSQIINETAAVGLNGSATDPDGSVSAYQWTQTSGPTVILAGASTPSASFTAPWVTTDTLLTFELAVTDNSGGRAIATTSVKVVNVRGADLVISVLGASVNTIKRGAAFTLSTTTHNAGDLATNVSTTTGLYLSSDSNITVNDMRIGSVWISGGLVGSLKATRTLSLPSTLAPGTYFLGAIADYTKRQSEISEVNNSLMGVTIQVTN